MNVGVLALQGDFREHIAAARICGHNAYEIRKAEELNGIEALILPGGESTTIVHLAQLFNLYEPIKEKISEGFPDLKIPEPIKTPSAPICIINAASAGVAIPPAVNSTTGNFPVSATSFTKA